MWGAHYRQEMRFGVRTLASVGMEAVLLGVRISQLRMDDLEAYFELVFGYHPRCLAPAEYRPKQGRSF